MNISNAPSDINFDQEFEILVNLLNASHNTDYYFQVALTSADYPAYFGYTQKEDGTWYKYTENYDLFYKITTSSEGSWSGKLKGKPDFEDNNFKGSGQYVLKIGRFTSSGKSHYWSDNSLALNINGPSPTPTYTPTPTNSPTPTPEPSSTPTPTSSPTPKPNNTPTNTPTLKPTVKPTNKASLSALLLTATNSASIAGLATSKAQTVSQSPNLIQGISSKNNPLLLLPVFLSIFFLAGSIFLFYHNGHEASHEEQSGN